MIPTTLIGLLARLLDRHFTRSDIVSIVMTAGAPGQEPTARDGRPLNKAQMVTEWLSRVNRETPELSMIVLGRTLRPLIEQDTRRRYPLPTDENSELNQLLAEAGLRYMTGGNIVSGVMSGSATPSLQEMLQQRAFPAVLDEFNRATRNVETSPREAVSAAANILEAVCKEYIVQHSHLQMPSDQTLAPVFRVVRDDLGLDPSIAADADVRRMLGGLATIVDSIGAFRTHASSAHAQSTSASQYDLTPRLARVAVHSAHAVVAFILETWDVRTSGSG